MGVIWLKSGFRLVRGHRAAPVLRQGLAEGRSKEARGEASLSEIGEAGTEDGPEAHPIAPCTAFEVFRRWGAERSPRTASEANFHRGGPLELEPKTVRA